MTPAKPKQLADDGRDPQVEAWLTQRHVTYTYQPTLPIDQIDKARSLANQARLEPLDDNVVERYAADITRGDVFPPVLALDRGPGKKVQLLGGNHRYHAHQRAGSTTIAAYIVDAATEPEMALRLTYEDNRRHGLPPSEAERIAQAVHLIDNGWTQENAAACVGVPAPRISQERSIQRAARRADTLEVPRTFHALPKTARYALGSIRSDPVFDQAARLAIDAKLSVAEIQTLVKRIDVARSDEGAMQLIGAEQEEHQGRTQRHTGGGARAPRTARSQLMTYLGGIRSLDPRDIVDSTPNPDVAKTLKQQILDTAAHLQKIIAAQ